MDASSNFNEALTVTKESISELLVVIFGGDTLITFVCKYAVFSFFPQLNKKRPIITIIIFIPASIL
jgi:hypothetical protein